MKILFFNLTTLESTVGADATYMVEALRKLYEGRTIPRNTSEKYKPIANLGSGTSFLINAKGLFLDKADIIYKAQYIRLAGRRDFISYKISGRRTLDLSYFPDIKIEAIRSNPLLDITDGHIHFKYEEIPSKTNRN